MRQATVSNAPTIQPVPSTEAGNIWDVAKVYPFSAPHLCGVALHIYDARHPVYDGGIYWAVDHGQFGEEHANKLGAQSVREMAAALQVVADYMERLAQADPQYHQAVGKDAPYHVCEVLP